MKAMRGTFAQLSAGKPVMQAETDEPCAGFGEISLRLVKKTVDLAG